MGIGKEFKELVFKRTGIESKNLVCPREKSDMTPCVAKDGDCAMADSIYGSVCVGCGIFVAEYLQGEKKKRKR